MSIAGISLKFEKKKTGEWSLSVKGKSSPGPGKTGQPSSRGKPARWWVRVVLVTLATTSLVLVILLALQIAPEVVKVLVQLIQLWLP